MTWAEATDLGEAAGCKGDRDKAKRDVLLQQEGCIWKGIHLHRGSIQPHHYVGSEG